MAAQKKYPDELRERAVQMVLEIRERDGKGQGELARVARLWALTLFPRVLIK
jgi:transposase